MFRTTGFALAALAAVAAWSATGLAIGPATAQERGGLRQRGPSATLDQIEANRGCPLSATSATIGVNRALGNGSAAQQQLGTLNPPGNGSGCRPLVTTQVAAGVNLAFGRGSSASQTIEAQGQRGALATNTFSRGFNAAAGHASSSRMRISPSYSTNSPSCRPPRHGSSRRHPTLSLRPRWQPDSWCPSSSHRIR